MKKIYLLFVAAALAACSAEPVENEGLTGLDANLEGKSNGKATSQDVGESFDVPELICAGEESTFTFNFADKSGKITLKVQLYGDDPETEEVEEWYNIFNEQFDGGGPENFNYIFEESGDFQIRYQIGGGGWTIVPISVKNCGCEESFNYVHNGDMTYTFTYVPEVDMLNAELAFTFPQANAEFTVEGWVRNGKENSQVWERSMNLFACTTYEWTVNLTRICMGSTGNNNVWTDFKVNGDSKKGDLTNITQACEQ